MQRKFNEKTLRRIGTTVFFGGLLLLGLLLLLRGELLQLLESGFCYFRKGRFQATNQCTA